MSSGSDVQSGSLHFSGGFLFKNDMENYRSRSEILQDSFCWLLIEYKTLQQLKEIDTERFRAQMELSLRVCIQYVGTVTTGLKATLCQSSSCVVDKDSNYCFCN